MNTLTEVTKSTKGRTALLFNLLLIALLIAWIAAASQDNIYAQICLRTPASLKGTTIAPCALLLLTIHSQTRPQRKELKLVTS